MNKPHTKRQIPSKLTYSRSDRTRDRNEQRLQCIAGKLLRTCRVTKGENRHGVMCREVKHLAIKYKLELFEVEKIIDIWNNNGGSNPPCDERKMKRVARFCTEHPLDSAPSQKPTLVSEDDLRSLITTGHTQAQLIASSPTPEPWSGSVDNYLDYLFPNNPLICIAASRTQFITLTRETFRGKVDDAQFIVPNAMTSARGRNLLGRLSRRCNDNTGPRRYAVVEWDFSAQQLENICGKDLVRTSQDACAALTGHLSMQTPLVMVVDTGGKSLHSWFNVQHHSAEEIKNFYSEAVRLWADPQMQVPCQLVRLPMGMRETGKLQKVIYFNQSNLVR